jgi:predicted alpha/beta superfamily hydrolase
MTKMLPLIILAFSATLAHSQDTGLKKSGNNNPFVLGEIIEIQSVELKEKRKLNIYLPEGYNLEDTIKYPVIYLLDGSADEDFIHIVGLVQFYSFEWIRQVPKSIVVGIATVDRIRDFTFPSTVDYDKIRYPTSGHSDQFIRFLEKDLQPFIQSNYRVNATKTIIGQSLGGLLATEILIKKPELFSKYIIVSPSLWWNNGTLLDQSVSKRVNADIYIAVGKEGLAPSAMARVMEVDANLLADKLKAMNGKQMSVHFDYLPLENHATILHQAVMNSFRILFPPVLEK